MRNEEIMNQGCTTRRKYKKTINEEIMNQGYTTGEKYDYELALHEDIIDYLEDNNYGHIDEDAAERLYDSLWTEDSVTGNGSGSYTFSSWKAANCIRHNLSLYRDCCEEWGWPENKEDMFDEETIDVCIRCYLLRQVLEEVIEEWNETHEEE